MYQTGMEWTLDCFECLFGISVDLFVNLLIRLKAKLYAVKLFVVNQWEN